MDDWESEEAAIFFDTFPSAEYPGLVPEFHGDSQRYVLARWWYCLFERLWSIRGMENALMDYTGYYAIVAGLMVGALAVFLLTVREKDWSEEARRDGLRLGQEDGQAEAASGGGLTPEQKRSLGLILASIALWFFGYNAVTSKYAVYAGNILHKD